MRMREAYRRTRKDSAAGVDGVTAAQYEADLEANLSGLLERFKSGRHRAPAVRRVHLEKPGTSKTRPIGIPTLEDKVLQRAVLMVLEPVYEQDFLECPPPPTIIIDLQGGLIQNLHNPSGARARIIVRDYDTEGADATTRDPKGRECIESIWDLRPEPVCSPFPRNPSFLANQPE